MALGFLYISFCASFHHISSFLGFYYAFVIVLRIAFIPYLFLANFLNVSINFFSFLYSRSQLSRWISYFIQIFLESKRISAKAEELHEKVKQTKEKSLHRRKQMD